MASVNKVILIGYLGRDPEVRHTQGGDPVCNFSIATSEKWNGKDGQKQERTEWHNVTVWGRMAELCGQYLAKGRSVYVEGKIQTREYQDKEGVTRKVVDIVASNVTFIGGRGEAGEVSASAGADVQMPLGGGRAAAAASGGGGGSPGGGGGGGGLGGGGGGGGGGWGGGGGGGGHGAASQRGDDSGNRRGGWGGAPF